VHNLPVYQIGSILVMVQSWTSEELFPGGSTGDFQKFCQGGAKSD